MNFPDYSTIHSRGCTTCDADERDCWESKKITELKFLQEQEKLARNIFWKYFSRFCGALELLLCSIDKTFALHDCEQLTCFCHGNGNLCLCKIPCCCLKSRLISTTPAAVDSSPSHRFSPQKHRSHSLEWFARARGNSVRFFKIKKFVVSEKILQHTEKRAQTFCWMLEDFVR